MVLCRSGEGEKGETRGKEFQGGSGCRGLEKNSRIVFMICRGAGAFHLECLCGIEFPLLTL